MSYDVFFFSCPKKLKNKNQVAQQSDSFSWLVGSRRLIAAPIWNSLRTFLKHLAYIPFKPKTEPPIERASHHHYKQPKKYHTKSQKCNKTIPYFGSQHNKTINTVLSCITNYPLNSNHPISYLSTRATSSTTKIWEPDSGQVVLRICTAAHLKMVGEVHAQNPTPDTWRPRGFWNFNEVMSFYKIWVFKLKGEPWLWEGIEKSIWKSLIVKYGGKKNENQLWLWVFALYLCLWF